MISAIRETTHKLRDEKGHELFNMSYRKIQSNKKSQYMHNCNAILKTLVPERIVEVVRN